MLLLSVLTYSYPYNIVQYLLFTDNSLFLYKFKFLFVLKFMAYNIILTKNYIILLDILYYNFKDNLFCKIILCSYSLVSLSFKPPSKYITYYYHNLIPYFHLFLHKFVPIKVSYNIISVANDSVTYEAYCLL